MWGSSNLRLWILQGTTACEMSSLLQTPRPAHLPRGYPGRFDFFLEAEMHPSGLASFLCLVLGLEAPLLHEGGAHLRDLKSCSAESSGFTLVGFASSSYWTL